MPALKRREDESPLIDGSGDGHSFVRNRFIKQPFIHEPEQISRDIEWTPAKVLVLFVAGFDAKKGNMLEWVRKKDVSLSTRGLEFKALPSGAHKVEDDCVVFKFGNLFGIACYHTLRSDAAARGASLKSFGILLDSHNDAMKYRPFLEEQVKKLHGDEQDFNMLNAHFQNMISRESGGGDVFDTVTSLKSSAPDSAVSVMKLLQGSLFSLWKLVLLRKRILFITTPPVDLHCQAVALLAELARHESIPNHTSPCLPFFYVNLHDFNLLASTKSYIACSTERVFEMKPDLFDCSLMDGKLNFGETDLARSCEASATDKAREKEIFEALEIGVLDEDDQFNATEFLLDYFNGLTQRVVAGLHEAAASSEAKLTAQDVSNMGLDPKQDLAFSNSLAVVYGINVDVYSASWCSK